ncbi:carboxyl transferase domain-containing protein [Tomitella fengzijianii]|uniref:Acetyl-CoA carboxyl transferase n=1 Tax=Tomitella fengzijianii TaxID=2597660 RepID=A0A516X1Q2_9ACTN|nr:carboxyl transferase domain-containing protein [Tomitella fengzijianii]QDQ96998.1 acetyl-CoA carboxyl transferase [Tomitella fengzijianii]
MPAPGAAPEHITAHAMIEAVVDEDSYATWDSAPVLPATTDAYADSLRRARERTGVDESVLTGEATVDGRRVALIACEFGFLGGSIGVAAAERITAAIERATAEGLPVIASPTSGGTRMQEGTTAFLQMVKIAAAAQNHKAAHLPYLVYLRNPTTGGVFASWGSLGHITVAQPGALIGFLGPRVYAALYGEEFPDGVQTAENLFRNGIVDGVVAPSDLRPLLVRALRVLAGSPEPPSHAAGPHAGPDPEAHVVSSCTDVPDVPAWQSVMLSRHGDRPGIRALLAHSAADLVALSGTGQGEVESAMVLALARIHGVPAVVLGQDRVAQTPTTPMGPGALREARRAMRLAEQLRLPLVLVIDTVGAALSVAAEERGLAPEIARCVADLVTLRTATVSIILGQGSGGGALALLPADRVLAAQHGWLAPLPPEGASAIVHRDTAHAPQMAGEQGVRSRDLLRDGIIDAVVLEEAGEGPAELVARAGAAIAAELRALADFGDDDRMRARLNRYRRLGLP